MAFSIIAAIGKNRELGKDNQLLWHLPSDLKFFKEKTSGHPVLMGRKTFDSLPGMLPNRKHYVVSRRHVTTDLSEGEAENASSKAACDNGSNRRVCPVTTGANSPEAKKNTFSTSHLTYINDLPQFIKDHQNDSEEIFVIGGGTIYQALLPYCQTLYLTEVAAENPTADTFFPGFDSSKYQREELGKGEDNGVKFTFVRYKKLN